MPGFNVNIKSNWDFINIYINDILHIQLPNEKMAVQSWKDVSIVTKYIIQFVNFKTGKVIMFSEYDNFIKFELILQEWDKHTNKST